MRNFVISLIACTSLVASATAGYFYSEIQSQKRMSAHHRENYTDRGRVCIEAASMIRNGDVADARQFLEAKAIHAIRGVPMGMEYSELLPKSQILMVSAMRYDQTYADVDMGVEKLMRDLPKDHPEMSDPVRTATSKL